MRQQVRAIAMVFALVALVAVPGFAQNASRQAAIEADIARAVDAVEQAAAVGAPVYAPALYNEANERLRMAREQYQADRRGTREQAQLTALEAMHAALAATEKALWIAEVREVTALAEDIRRFGGSVQAVAFTAEEALVTIDRGQNAREQAQFAEGVIAQARAAGAAVVAPDDLRTAENWVETAKKIARSDRNSDSARYLAYAAEMTARRAMYEAQRADVRRLLPGLRTERTRLAEIASERALAEERERRLMEERRAAELRAELERQAAVRRAEEIADLRRQVEENTRMLREQFERDRMARLEAERELESRVAAYERALQAGNAAELERLRREVEDQARLLRIMIEGGTTAEEILAADVARLRDAIERARVAGMPRAELDRRLAELRLLEERLATIRQERATAAERLAGLTARQEAAIASAENLRRQMEQETADLRIEINRTQAELEEAREELRAQRAAEAQQRREFEELQAALSEIAETRDGARGLVVTLPGIFFDVGKAELKPGAERALAEIAEELRQNPNARITVEGHTDSVGSAEMNRELSHRRADAVRDYLVSRGVDADRVSTIARGEAMPVATNATVAGRQQNRRVELIINEAQTVARAE